MTATYAAAARKPSCRKPATRKPAAPKDRAVRLICTTQSLVLFAVREGEQTDRYVARRVPSDRGIMFEVEKVGHIQDAYMTCLQPEDDTASCTCRGHVRYGYCRHAGALTALRAAGKID